LDLENKIQNFSVVPFRRIMQLYPSVTLVKRYCITLSGAVAAIRYQVHHLKPGASTRVRIYA